MGIAKAFQQQQCYGRNTDRPYEEFVENNSATHITTNLSASEIENTYGNRIRSRLRQMFNLIAFNKDAKDN